MHNGCRTIRRSEKNCELAAYPSTVGTIEIALRNIGNNLAFTRQLVKVAFNLIVGCDGINTGGIQQTLRAR